MRLLVDTNVFLDLILQRENYRIALEFFAWCREHRNQTYVTSMSFRDIEYVVMKKVHNRKRANSILMEVYSICSKVIGISADSTINSIYEDYKDFEDELIIQTAQESMLDAIITNNAKDFEDCGFPVFSPKEIMDSISY